ncbi:MAG: amidohydrolase [Proteobacteria bacterium]|nr:amidohydrolase [Pseudomonadota bacterium]
MKKMQYRIVLVAMWALILLNAAWAQSADNSLPVGPKKTTESGLKIFFNGTILTVDENMSEAQAIAIKDGKIIAVGTNKEVLKHRTRNTKFINLKSKTLMPGFVETHSHPVLKMIVENYTVDIRPATGHTDGVEIMDTVRKTIAKAKPDEYLVFFGWDPLLQKGLKNPTRKELDVLSPNNPIFIWGNSVHVAFANTRALELAGINKNTPDPGGSMGGSFGHDKDGELDGRIDQGGPVGIVIAPFLKSKIDNPQKAAEAIYNGWLVNASDGVTTISDDVLLEEAMAIYQLTAEKFKTIRVRGYAVDYQKWKPFEGDAMIKVNGGKLFVDGSPWTGTITMTQPYLVNNTTVKIMDTPAGYMQKPYVSQEELQTFIDDILKSKRSAEIHVEGDQAIQMALDAIEKGLIQYPWDNHRIRLAHVPMIRDDQIERAKKLGAQLTFLMAHVKYWGDVIPTLVGDKRGQRWCPVASAKKYGANFAFHFDGPTSPNKPLETLQTVTTRKTVSGKVLGPEERISIDDAIRGYTINAAYQLFMEKEVGSIEPGKYADMIILSDNPRKVDLEKLSKIKVLATYVNGEEIWRAKK